MELFHHHRLFCRRFWFWNSIVVVFVILGGGFFYTVSSTNFLRVSAIDIEGSDIISQTDIRAAAIAQGMKNFSLRSLFGPDTIVFWFLQKKDIENGLPLVLPLAADVHVAVDAFTGKKVSLSLREKEMAGVWCDSKESCFIFDNTGFIFAPIARPEGVLLPLIEDIYDRSLTIGQRIVPHEQWFAMMMDIAARVKKIGVPIAKMELNDPIFREWSIVLPSGLRVYFSFEFVPENFDIVFKDLIDRLSAQKITYLDFRVPKRVYYK